MLLQRQRHPLHSHRRRYFPSGPVISNVAINPPVEWCNRQRDDWCWSLLRRLSPEVGFASAHCCNPVKKPWSVDAGAAGDCSYFLARLAISGLRSWIAFLHVDQLGVALRIGAVRNLLL